MERIFLSSLLTALFLVPSFAQQNKNSTDWLRKITPYKMTVEEVEKLIFAKPEENLTMVGYNVYKLKEGTIGVAYSPGRCVDGRPYGKWELEKGVIMDTDFHPKKWRDISYYEKDMESLKKDFSVAHHPYYEDTKKGVGYTLQHSKVYSITFFGRENINPVRCKE